jgi:hypothetical protein
MDISMLLPMIASVTGLSPATLLLIVGVVISVSNVVTKLIPDDATGGMAILRKITALAGLYVASRVTSGVTANDIARGVLLQTSVDPVKKAEFIEASAEDALAQIKKAI